MAEVRLRDGCVIGDYAKPYFVAEVNSSHNGNLDVAKEMIEKAKEIGCNCVKFQSWSPETLYSKTYYDKNPISKRIVKKFSFGEEQLKQLANHCRQNGISFASTPYSEREVDFLVEECDVPFIKIASMEVNNLAFLQYIAKKNYPIVMATGMSDMEEIRQAVDTILDAGNEQLCILHCLSVYPAPFEQVNLNNILGLREQFPNIPIGFSDHTVGIEVPVASIAFGACLIEKHFTLDNKKIGMDNQMATEADGIRQMIEACKNVYSALGSRERMVSDSELEQRSNMRRSIVAARNLAAGTILSEDDLTAKRPGNGIAPTSRSALLGKKVIHDIEKDCMIFMDDLE